MEKFEVSTPTDRIVVCGAFAGIFLTVKRWKSGRFTSASKKKGYD
jgi:hypothetical protein